MTQPNKSLGQYWLQDEASLEAMVKAADVSADDTVLEIGPGQGSLTAELVQRAKQVAAVEFDAELALSLPGRLKSIQQHNTPHSKVAPWKGKKDGVVGNLRVVHQDILRFDL